MIDLGVRKVGILAVDRSAIYWLIHFLCGCRSVAPWRKSKRTVEYDIAYQDNWCRKHRRECCL